MWIMFQQLFVTQDFTANLKDLQPASIVCILSGCHHSSTCLLPNVFYKFYMMVTVHTITEV